jgi:SAM-dependent methyltransferase
LDSRLLFEHMYRASNTNWDTGQPQPAVRKLCTKGLVRGSVLDPGCGTGWHSILFAQQGCDVVGVDVSATAIDRAISNGTAAHVAARFVRADVTALTGYDHTFDTVVDSAFYHTFINQLPWRTRYLQTLRRVMKPGGMLYLFGFAPGKASGYYNRRYLEASDFAVFDNGFTRTHLGSAVYRLAGGQRIPMWEFHAQRKSVR